MGIPFEVDVSEVDETFVGAPDDAVIELSRRKAEAVALRHNNALVLAADTLVFGGETLGKPSDDEHAVQMLRSLSGNWHSVFTGMTLIHTQTGKMVQRVCETRVHFVPLSEEEIIRYVESGEPSDKAGAYAIQGMGGMFIDRIEGCYSNVVGLPMSVLKEMIRDIK